MMIVISGAPVSLYGKWCVYSQRTPGAVVYVGFCQAAKFMQFPDARKNKTWLNLCQHDPLLVTVVDGLFDNDAEAFAAASDLVRMHSPVCNRDAARRASHRPFQSLGGVICEQTQKSFPSAAAAADYYKADRAAMGKHLAGAVGYRTVLGLTFRRE